MSLSLIWAYLVAPLAFVLGSLKLIVLLHGVFGYIKQHYLRKKVNFLERYGGKGTWALVTGASDGIGLEFCK